MPASFSGWNHLDRLSSRFIAPLPFDNKQLPCAFFCLREFVFAFGQFTDMSICFGLASSTFGSIAVRTGIMHFTNNRFLRQGNHFQPFLKRFSEWFFSST